MKGKFITTLIKFLETKRGQFFFLFIICCVYQGFVFPAFYFSIDLQPAQIIKFYTVVKRVNFIK